MVKTTLAATASYSPVRRVRSLDTVLIHVSSRQVKFPCNSWSLAVRCPVSSRQSPLNFSGHRLFSGQRDPMNTSCLRTAETRCHLRLGTKQKWPPKKDGHSCVGKLFGAAKLSGSAAPYQARRGLHRATLLWCRRPESRPQFGQRVSTRTGHTPRGHLQES